MSESLDRAITVANLALTGHEERQLDTYYYWGDRTGSLYSTPPDLALMCIGAGALRGFAFGIDGVTATTVVAANVVGENIKRYPALVEEQLALHSEAVQQRGGPSFAPTYLDRTFTGPIGNDDVVNDSPRTLYEAFQAYSSVLSDKWQIDSRGITLRQG